MATSDTDSSSDDELEILFPPYVRRPMSGKFSITKRFLGRRTNKDLYSEPKNSFRKNLGAYIPHIILHYTKMRRRPHRGSTSGQRYVFYERESRHNLIIRDYFSGENLKYSRDMFRRRFRMDENLFNRILKAISDHDIYFTQRFDANGRPGLSPLPKMVASLQLLAYGVLADFIDEYVQMAKSTSIECLLRFCDAMIDIFEERYIRKPNSDDIARLFEENKARGFPGMLGSLDCMHWHWSNCPKAWHGMYKNGFKRVPTLILGVVASKDLWIWHAFFGMAGTNNDINVLDRSPLFDDIVNSVAPLCNFKVQGNQYNMCYYLSDGIYPPYANTNNLRAKKFKRETFCQGTRKCEKRRGMRFSGLEKMMAYCEKSSTLV